jgi:dihydrofolate reductase
MSMTRYYTATTLDGFLADEANSLAWLFEVEGDVDHAEEGFPRFFADIGAMAMGATTYEWVLEYEGALEHPEKWATFYGDVPLWVFSHRDLPVVPGANITITSADVASVHAEMAKAAGDKDIWLVGGGDLAGQFAEHGLLDQIEVSVAPVTLGAGAPLLPRRLLASNLKLTKVGRNGQFAELTYRVVHGRDDPAGAAPERT